MWKNMNFLCRFGKANFPFARSTMPLCLRMLIYAAFMHRKSAPSAAEKMLKTSSLIFIVNKSLSCHFNHSRAIFFPLPFA
jgi:hypothetical protein